MSTLLIALTCSVMQGPASLNEKVVEFARSKLGQKVGDGECVALASEALRAAGARDRPPWGRELTSLADARPGDVLTFENAVFLQRTLREDGAVVRQTLKAPHHAAIVSRVERAGKDVIVTVLHQNTGFKRTSDVERKTVQEWTFRLSEKRAGAVKGYRPVPIPEPGSGSP